MKHLGITRLEKGGASAKPNRSKQRMWRCSHFAEVIGCSGLASSLVTRPSTSDGLVQWGIPLNGANRPITKIPVIMYTPPVRRARCSVQGWKMQINPSANLTMLLLSFMPAARSHDQRREARNRNSLYEPSFRPPIPSTRSCK